jgi:GntR family transcriptional regulator
MYEHVKKKCKCFLLGVLGFFVYDDSEVFGMANYLYLDVYKQLKAQITAGEYKVGEMLPNEKDLSALYEVSRQTIRAALQVLFNEGFILRIKGKGTFVKAKALYQLSNMASFSEIIGNQKGVPNSIIYESKEMKVAPDINQKIGLPAGANCYYIERVRRNGDDNLCLEFTYINPKKVPGLIDLITPRTSLFELYEKQFNLTLSYGDYELEAINSDANTSRKLGIDENSSILLMHANIYLSNGEPLYYVIAYYVADKYVFKTSLRR